MTHHLPLPQLLKDRDRDRLRAYDDNLTFYNGQQWDTSLPDNRRRRLTFNYARTAIHKVTSHVAAAHRIEISPPADAGAEAPGADQATAALALIYADQDLRRLDYDTEIDTAILGDGCYKVTLQGDQPVVTAPDVSGIFPWTVPHSLSAFQRVAHRYELPAADVAALWGVTTKKDPETVIEDWTATTLDIYIGAAPTPAVSAPNPYPFIPFVIYPNESQPKKWHGLSDLENLRAPAQELNEALTRVSAILRLSGNPITVLEGVEQQHGIAAVPGAVWELPPDTKAYLLDLLSGGGVGLHIDYIERIYRALHDLSEVPRAAFAGTDRNLSGVALEIELRPLSQKVARKRLIRDRAYIQRARMVLTLIGQLNPRHSLTVATDSGVVPTDRSMDGGFEAAVVQAGISSRRSAMARLGEDDPEAEFERIKEEGLELGAVAAVLNPPAAG